MNGFANWSSKKQFYPKFSLDFYKKSRFYQLNLFLNNKKNLKIKKLIAFLCLDTTVF